MDMMVQLTKEYFDLSEKDSFVFAFRCDRCGREWRSTPIPFSGGGFADIKGDETLELIWANEHRIAFERACIEAMLHFNHCRICGRWVCDVCFHTSEDAFTDVCVDCAEPGLATG
jgi:hypothetical protein